MLQFLNLDTRHLREIAGFERPPPQKRKNLKKKEGNKLASTFVDSLLIRPSPSTVDRVSCAARKRPW